MKTITQERLFKAHKNAWESAKSAKPHHIVCAYLKYGTNNLIPGVEQYRDFRDRLRIELNQLGAFDLTDACKRLVSAGISGVQIEEEIEKHFSRHTPETAFLLASWWLLDRYESEKYQARRQWLRRIQVKAGVSGLVDETIDFGHTVLTFKEPDPREDLELLPSDHEFLAEQRFFLADNFIKAAFTNPGMRLFKADANDNWEKCEANEVLAAIARSGWATASCEVKFVNHKELNAKGITIPTNLPISADHKKEWEIRLFCGTGSYSLYVQKDEQTWGFVAYQGSDLSSI